MSRIVENEVTLKENKRISGVISGDIHQYVSKVFLKIDPGIDINR